MAPAGTPFATVTPGVNSRMVSSFLFGDGNALINQVLVGQGLNPIPSLDGIILNNRRTLERQSNIGAGLRLSRYIGKRTWLDWTNEVDFDYDDGSFEINEKEEADSFRAMHGWVTSLESLFGACGAPCAYAAGARKLSTREKGHQVSSALTANYDLRPWGRFTPYLGGGGGLIASNFSVHLIFAVTCITTNSVTMAPIVTAKPVKPLKKNAYENSTRYTNCVTPASKNANFGPTTILK